MLIVIYKIFKLRTKECKSQVDEVNPVREGIDPELKHRWGEENFHTHILEGKKYIAQVDT